MQTNTKPKAPRKLGYHWLDCAQVKDAKAACNCGGSHRDPHKPRK